MPFELAHNLSVAVLDFSPGWELLLEQIGLPCRVLHNVNELLPQQAAVTVVNRHLWSEEVDSLDAYVRSGGALLDVGRFLPCREPKRFRRARVRSLFIDPKEGLSDHQSILDLHCRGIRLREGGCLNGFASVESRGSGTIAFLGFDPGRLMLDHRVQIKQFPGIAGCYPAERVGLVSKGEIAKLVRQLLMQLYHRRGLPFVRKRSFPEDAPNVLCFRIDTDYGSRQQINALRDLGQRTQTPITWFLHAEAHKDWLNCFREFQGDEVALHCWRHRTFPDVAENRANIADGLTALQGEGISVDGFSAPNGMWNHGLAQAIDERHFLYSSEFALSYDALPFQPILPISQRVNTRFYRSLQIPVHPISVGNLMRARMNEEQMVEYYRAVIDNKARDGDPLIFYHHPTHERWGVMEAMLSEAKSREGRSLTFAEYARWWKLRGRAHVQAEFDNGMLDIRWYNGDSSVWLDVQFPDGRKTMIPGGERKSGTSLFAYSGVNSADVDSGSADYSMLDASSAIRRFSLKMKRRALHDWIIRTSR